MFSLQSVILIAQPANDDCSFAQVIILPPSGEICFQSSNLNASVDGISNACNGPGGGNEVWFSFVAHGLNNTITAYPINAPNNAQQLALTIPDGNCTNTIINTCAAASGPLDTVSVTWNFAPGTVVWFEVTSLLGDGDFEVCIQSWNPQTQPAFSCFTATRICNKQSFISVDTSIGSSGVQPSCFPLPVDDDVWYKFSVSKTGTCEWSATPFDAVEFDWAMYDITAGCPGIEVACNYTVGGAGSPIGMSPASPGCLFSNFCPPIIVTKGSTYAIVIDKFNSPLGNGFKMEWGGTFEMIPGTIDATFEVNPPFGCDSVTISITDSSFGVGTYSWNFGNGNTSTLANPPTQSYNTPGNYAISLLTTDSAGFGCTSVASQSVSVLQAPSDSIYGDTTLCVGQNANLFYGGVDTVNTSFVWNFDGGTVVSGSFWGPFVVNWATQGLKAVTLQVTDVVTGCTSPPDTFFVNVIGAPVTTFSVAPGACVGQNVQVIFTGSAGPGAVFNWNFGTATVVSGSGSGPYIINFATTGSDSISLAIVDASCPAAVTTTNYITISNTPTATFTLPPVSCQFQSNLITYTGTGSPAATYNWNFGSGTITSGTGQGPYVVEWATPGTYFVSLTVVEGGCASVTFSDSIVISSSPVASINLSANLVCGADPITVTFTGTAGAGAAYNWNFGTATIISGSGAGPYSISFPNSGWNSIGLSITENGCSSLTVTDSVNVGFQPIAVAGLDQLYCVGDSVQIGFAPTPGYTYSWSPASGLNNAGISNPWVTVLNIGVVDTTIPFILTVDSLFCSDTDTVDITVRPNQTTNIIAQSSQCFAGNNFTFINGSPQIIGAAYNWNFGPNATPATSNVINPSPIVFNTVGAQTVVLTASANGCPANIDTFLIDIYPMPVADFVSDKMDGCPPLLVQFTDASVTDTGSTYAWTFGSLSSNLQNPQISFSQSGLLDVSLIVTTSFGCKDTITKLDLIDVWVKPNADFIAEPPNTNIFFPTVDFTDNSSNGTTCYYDFGDGSISTLCDISHTYTDTGSYSVMFITTNTLGCIDTVIKIVNVEPFYTFYAPNAFTPNGDLINDYWVWQGSNITQFELRVFNRWGQLVFETNSFFEYWNGSWQNDGELVQDGVYIYEVLLREGTGRQRAFGGHVSVLK